VLATDSRSDYQSNNTIPDSRITNSVIWTICAVTFVSNNLKTISYLTNIWWYNYYWLSVSLYGKFLCSLQLKISTLPCSCPNKLEATNHLVSLQSINWTAPPVPYWQTAVVCPCKAQTAHPWCHKGSPFSYQDPSKNIHVKNHVTAKSFTLAFFRHSTFIQFYLIPTDTL